jgi:hypothetical protein
VNRRRQQNYLDRHMPAPSPERARILGATTGDWRLDGLRRCGAHGQDQDRDPRPARGSRRPRRMRLTELRWVCLAELAELMSDISGIVCRYLRQVLGT